MTGARNGHVARIASAYPEFVDMEPLPGRTQDEFREAFEALISRRATPLTHAEYQLAYAAGRELWRACWWGCARARGDEVRAEMHESADHLGVIRCDVESRVPDDPAAVGRR